MAGADLALFTKNVDFSCLKGQLNEESGRYGDDFSRFGYICTKMLNCSCLKGQLNEECGKAVVGSKVQLYLHKNSELFLC